VGADGQTITADSTTIGRQQLAGHKGDAQMPFPVVSYAADDETVVRIEVDPSSEWEDVSTDRIIAKIQEAVKPAVRGAKAVLDAVKDAKPDEMEVKFGIKVSGDANWFIARAATEANFDVTLTWKRKQSAE
jgi:Trypsin-co-occurring domain 1